MTVTKQLIDNVNKIKTTLNEISVYNLDVKTAIELYYELAKKVNEVINELSRFEGVVSDEVIKQNEKLIYLLGEGLKEQVVIKIDNLIKDGTIQDLINNKIFNNLNNKIDTFIQEANEQFNTKANENEVVKKGYGTLSDFDESTRQAIQGMGSTEINAVLGDGNVIPKNLSFDTIKNQNSILPTASKDYVRGTLSSGILNPANYSRIASKELIKVKNVLEPEIK